MRIFYTNNKRFRKRQTVSLIAVIQILCAWMAIPSDR